MMHDDPLERNKQLLQRAAPKPTFLSKPLHAYQKQEYATPLFVLRETLAGFARHNTFGLSASLSFYALFALIPLVLLMFFLLSFPDFTACSNFSNPAFRLLASLVALVKE